MRVLLTGHHGYLGSVAGARARRGRARRHRPRHGLLPRLRPRAADHEARGGARARHPRRDRRAPARLRRRRPPRRALERPARRPRPRSYLEINFRRHRRPRRPRARPVSAGSSSPRRAACTAPPRTSRSTEDAPLKPLTAYAESKVRSEEALAELADDDFSPVFMRNATVLRRLAPAAPRHRPQQPRRLGVHDRRGPDPERRDALAARDPHRGTSPTRPSALLEAPATPSTARRSTSAPTPRTTRCATWPSSRARRPGSRSSIGGASDPTRGPTGSTSESSPGTLPELGFAARRARERAKSSVTPTETAGLTFEEFDGQRFTRLKRLQDLLGEGKLSEIFAGDDLARDGTRGRVRRRDGADRGRARVVRPHLRRERIRSAGARFALRAEQRRLQHGSGHPARHALPGGAARRGEARPLRPRAPSTT